MKLNKDIIRTSTIYGKLCENHIETTKLKCQRLREIINLNFLIVYILHQILEISLSMSSKTVKHWTIIIQ